MSFSEKQDKVGKYSQGRHDSISCLYLAQTYSKIPKQIRNHFNYLILFKQVWTDILQAKEINGNSFLEQIFSQKWKRPLTSRSFSKPRKEI